jgi:hypothetical protein
MYITLVRTPREWISNGKIKDREIASVKRKARLVIVNEDVLWMRVERGLLHLAK